MDYLSPDRRQAGPGGQMTTSRSRTAIVLMALALLAGACSETSSTDGAAGGSTTTTGDGTTTTVDPESPATTGTTSTDGDPGGTTAPVDADTVMGRHAGQEWFLGTISGETEAADPAAEPIRIGLINQENSPAGSFPEIRGAAEAGVAFINAELGGVGGRPLELITCEAVFDATVSQNCAQDLIQQGVVAFVGGIDVTSNGSIPILEANGVPHLGGIPANAEDQVSDHMFFFSGGTTGGVAAMLKHAADNGAEKVFLAFGDFPSFANAANDYAAPLAEHLGMEIQLAPFNLLQTDFLPTLTDAADSGADAVIVLAADSACVNVISDFAELVPGAQLYMAGACAIDAIVDAVGDAMRDVIMNNEGPNDPDDPGGSIYQDAVDTYAVDPADGAGTVGFRGLMNLWSILDEIGPDVTSADVLETVRAAVDRPSFWGHPFTCDGNQIPGLPALCAPQQTLFQFIDGTAEGVPFADGEEWLDTVALYQEALG